MSYGIVNEQAIISAIQLFYRELIRCLQGEPVIKFHKKDIAGKTPQSCLNDSPMVASALFRNRCVHWTTQSKGMNPESIAIWPPGWTGTGEN